MWELNLHLAGPTHTTRARMHTYTIRYNFQVHGVKGNKTSICRDRSQESKPRYYASGSCTHMPCHHLEDLFSWLKVP